MINYIDAEKIRRETISTIQTLLDERNEKEVTFGPLVWGGYANEPITAERITTSELALFYKDKEIQRVQWEFLTQKKLSEIVEALRTK